MSEKIANALQDPTPEPLGTGYVPAADRLPQVEAGEEVVNQR